MFRCDNFEVNLYIHIYIGACMHAPFEAHMWDQRTACRSSCSPSNLGSRGWLSLPTLKENSFTHWVIRLANQKYISKSLWIILGKLAHTIGGHISFKLGKITAKPQYALTPIKIFLYHSTHSTEIILMNHEDFCILFNIIKHS